MVRMFSKEAIARFDYVFTAAMTIVDDSGSGCGFWIADEVRRSGQAGLHGHCWWTGR